MLAHLAGIPVEEALMAAPTVLAGVTVLASYVRATAARIGQPPPMLPPPAPPPPPALKFPWRRASASS